MSFKQATQSNYLALTTYVQTQKHRSSVKHVYLCNHQLNFVNLLLTVAGKLIKEVVSDMDAIEVKTVVKNVESLLWILKYATLGQTEQIVDIVAFDNPN